MFNKAILAVATLAAAQTALATPTPQLDGLLPSIVCLTGPLTSVASGLLDSLPVVGGVLSVVSCSSGETCTALPLPLVGSLIPIGVSAQAEE